MKFLGYQINFLEDGRKQVLVLQLTNPWRLDSYLIKLDFKMSAFTKGGNLENLQKNPWSKGSRTNCKVDPL